MTEVSRISELSNEELDRLRSNKDIKDRIENDWPLRDPFDFSKHLKFEKKYYPFEEVKALTGYVSKKDIHL